MLSDFLSSGTRHRGHDGNITSNGQPGNVTGRHRAREYHWVVKPGRQDASGGCLPPFVGCPKYRFQDGLNHRLEKLTKFRGIDIDLVNSWRASGAPPDPTQSMKDAEECVSELLQGIGEFCKSPVHEYEKCKLVRVGCSVRYHFLVPRMLTDCDIRPSLAVIIGVGTHHHVRPLLKPNRELVKRITGNELQNNLFARTQHIIDAVVNEGGIPPRESYVKHIMRSMKRDSHPFGRGIQAIRMIIRRDLEALENGENVQRYIWDCRVSDTESGISVIFSQRELLQRAASDGVMAIDGTHGTANTTDEDDDQILELINVVCQGKTTGRTYSAAHQLCSRKTEKSRYEFFLWLFGELKKEGTRSPFSTSNEHRKFMSLTTDFETAFLKAAGLACEAVWADPGKTWTDYSKRIVSPCAFHRKQMLLRKSGNDSSSSRYQIVDNAEESFKTEEQMGCLLQSFDIWGEPWGKFSDWLRGNVVARWLMFPSVLHKGGDPGCVRRVLHE